MSKYIERIKRFSPVITIFLLSIVLYQIDINELIRILAKSKVIYILGAGFVLSPILLVLLAFRLKLILRHLEIEANFREVFYFNTHGLLWGEFSPGKIGELLRAKFIIRNCNGSIGLSIFSVTIDRIYDIVVLFLSLMLSCWLMMTMFGMFQVFGVLAAAFFLMLLLCLTFCLKNRIFYSSQKVIEYFLGRYTSQFSFHYSEFFSGFRKLSVKNHAEYFTLSIMIWITKLLSLPLFAKAIDIEVSFIFMLAVGVLSIGITLLPISISGIGTREVVFIYFLSYMNISPEAAVMISLLFYLFGLWSILVAFILVSLNSFNNRIRKV